MPRPAARNLITDVPGLRVGHSTDERVRTGVTVLVCAKGWAAGIDVRGGGPGTREGALLDLANSVERIDAVELDQLRELAAELFEPSRLSVAGVGPAEADFRSAIEPLGAAEVSA